MTATYRHLLVPTDGTVRSRRAIAMAVSLAAQCNARVTSIYVVPEGVPTLFSGDQLYGSGVVSPRVRQRIRKGAAEALDAVAREADKAGVDTPACALSRTHPGRRSCARRVPRIAT